jgi:hypothetical protein
MNVIEVSALSGLATNSLATAGQRAVDLSTTEQFRKLMTASDCEQTPTACGELPAAKTGLQSMMNLDIEKVLTANLPAANASPAEFAMGMLRAQVKVSQAAVAIEMVSKTTQSLSQGVQSLTARS